FRNFLLFKIFGRFEHIVDFVHDDFAKYIGVVLVVGHLAKTAASYQGYSMYRWIVERCEDAFDLSERINAAAEAEVRVEGDSIGRPFDRDFVALKPRHSEDNWVVA